MVEKEGRKKKETRPVGTRWKTLDVTRGEELLKRLDPDWPARLRLVEDGGNEELWEYRSATDEGKWYRLQATKTITGWLGACACPGTRVSDVAPGAIVPCKHLTALMILGKESGIPGAEECMTATMSALEKEPPSVPTIEPDRAPAMPDRGIDAREPEKPALGGPGLTERPNPVALRAPKTEAIRHSASSLPLVCECSAASRAVPGPLIGSSGEAADIGSAVHELFEMVVQGKEITGGDIASAVARHGVTDKADEVRILAYLARKQWRDGITGDASVISPPLRTYFEKPQTEVEMNHTMTTPQGVKVTLTMRADVFEIINDEERSVLRAVVLDLKTGRRDRNHTNQLMGYAVGACGKDKRIDEVTLIASWVNLGFYDAITVSRAQVIEWAQRFLKYSAVWDGRSYTTGEHCTYCPHAMTCEARHARARALAVPFVDVPLSEVRVPAIFDAEGNLRNVDELAACLTAARAIQKAAKDWIWELELVIGERGAQPIPGQLGMVLGFSERAGKRKIEPTKGWPILKQWLPDAELAPLLEIGLTAVQEAVAAKAEKGKGAAAKRQVEADLRAVDAVVDGKPSRTLMALVANVGGSSE